MSRSLHDDPVAVINRQRGFTIDPRRLQQAVAGVLARCGEEGQEVTVVLVSDRTMKTVNMDYRGINAATDVISFAMREGPGGDPSGVLLGDLVISLETVHRQSSDPVEDGRPVTGTPQRELALMAIHGLLHLLGYRHEDGPKRAQEMIRRERELFDATWETFPSF